jgi:hypothetical protein
LRHALAPDRTSPTPDDRGIRDDMRIERVDSTRESFAAN